MQAEKAPEYEGGTALGDAGENGDAHTTASSNVRPLEQDDSEAPKAAWQDRSALGSFAPEDEEGWEGADDLDIALEPSSKADDPAAAHSSVTTGEASAVSSGSGREAKEPLKAAPETGSQTSLFQSGKQDNSCQHGVADSGQAVPLHECWAALLRRMLEHGSSLLVATVLRTIEDAAARKPFLLSLAEAIALPEAARAAGQLLAGAFVDLVALFPVWFILHIAGMPLWP